MNKLLKLVLIPLVFAIFNVLYWPYAMYQGLSVAGFGLTLGAVSLVGLGAWIYLNRILSRKVLLVIAIALLVVVAAEIFAYDILMSLPRGWENLQY